MFLFYCNLINKPNINSETSESAVVTALKRNSLVLVSSTLIYSPTIFHSLAAKVNSRINFSPAH